MFYLQIVEQGTQCHLSIFRPLGNGYNEVIVEASEYADPALAFEQSIGRDRQARVIQVGKGKGKACIHSTNNYTQTLIDSWEVDQFQSICKYG